MDFHRVFLDGDGYRREVLGVFHDDLSHAELGDGLHGVSLCALVDAALDRCGLDGVEVFTRKVVGSLLDLVKFHAQRIEGVAVVEVKNSTSTVHWLYSFYLSTTTA